MTAEEFINNKIQGLEILFPGYEFGYKYSENTKEYFIISNFIGFTLTCRRPYLLRRMIILIMSEFKNNYKDVSISHGIIKD